MAFHTTDNREGGNASIYVCFVASGRNITARGEVCTVTACAGQVTTPDSCNVWWFGIDRFCAGTVAVEILADPVTGLILTRQIVRVTQIAGVAAETIVWRGLKRYD